MMKSTLSRALCAALLISLAAGCKKKGETDAMGDQGGDAAVTEPEAPKVNVPSHVKTMAENFNRVHFEFDSSDLTADSKSALDQNVELMQKHSDVKVRVQGHADEQGTTEYNLALGQRRAESVKEYLIGQGVAPSRLTVISYGEEQPLVSGHSEKAWSKNRRAEFEITWSSSDAVKGSNE